MPAQPAQPHHIALQTEAIGHQPVHHIDLAMTAGAVQDVVEAVPATLEVQPVGSST